MAATGWLAVGRAQAQVAVSSSTRLAKVQEAARRRDGKAVDGLIAGFSREPSANVRAWIVLSAARLRRPQAASLLTQALADRSPVVRSMAATQLRELAPEGWDEALVQALAAERDPGAKMSMISALGYSTDPSVVSVLAQELGSDADPDVRLRAALSLRRIGTGPARKALAAAAKDSDARVRGAAR